MIALRALTFAATAALLATPVQAEGTDDAAERRLVEAYGHAQALQAGATALELHIGDRETADDGMSWPLGIPPAAVGWRDDWTERGLRARYCDDVLLVFADAPALRGVGGDQRAVRLSPQLIVRGLRVTAQPLHWLDDGTAWGRGGRDDIALPDCMTSGLPDERVALARAVVDPFLATREQDRRETRRVACADGLHGPGVIERRLVAQDVNRRGEPVGDPRPGEWTRPYGDNGCIDAAAWIDKVEVTETDRQETRSTSCGAGQTGSRTEARTVRTRELIDGDWHHEVEAVTVDWHQTGSSCQQASYSGGGGDNGGGGGGGGYRNTYQGNDGSWHGSKEGASNSPLGYSGNTGTTRSDDYSCGGCW